MGSQLPVPGRRDDTGAAELAEAFARVAMVMLATRHADPPARAERPSPMLTVSQAAALMGLSRTTVIRKADAGELPCVIVSRGTRKTMRRFPRAAIEELVAHGGSAAQVDLREYTTRWLAEAAARMRGDEG